MKPPNAFRLLLLVVMIWELPACIRAPDALSDATARPTPTLFGNFFQQTRPPTSTSQESSKATSNVEATDSPSQEALPVDVDLVVRIDTANQIGPISPLIYGVSGGEVTYLESLRPTFRSWGGNPSTRYNWKLGNAWNAGKDWLYQNTNYEHPDGVSEADVFLQESVRQSIPTRLAVPILGWVAKDTSSCSFPQADGSCGMADGATCEKPDIIANPETANVASGPDSIREWVQHLQGLNLLPEYIALDNEPELWGYTHYDVHPSCTTYEEVLEKYLAYSAAIHSIAPQVKLAGPVACCWFSYWNIAPGPAEPGPDQPNDYIAWFLQSMRRHDETTGYRSLDALDVHFYPQAGVYNENTDPETNALRLRSTRALWDPTYIDESWINEPIYFIPRMKALIEQYYPGMQLGISEWNWGADTSINGALAIAEVLGIYGREGVDYAAYWRNPPLDSPGFFAYKLYTNYDDRGGRFEGESIRALSSQPDWVSAYAAYDAPAGQLKIMLLNIDPQKSAESAVQLQNFTMEPAAKIFRYSSAHPAGILEEETLISARAVSLTLPSYSITLLVLSSQ